MNNFTRHALCMALATAPLSSYAVDLGTYHGVDLNLTLQVNRALMYADDGNDTELFFVDNINSNTRFNLKAETVLEGGTKVGGQFEAEYPSNSSYSVNFDNKSTRPELGERHMEVWFADDWGKVTIGQGDGAANGIMEMDLSGTGVINWADPSLLGGGIQFNRTGPTIGSTMNNLDFESRYDRLRYDTPNFGAFGIALSQGVKGSSDITEIGLRFNHTTDSGLAFKGGLGYSTENTEDGNAAGDENTVGGSVAVLLPGGLNAAIAIGKSGDDDEANPDAEFKSAKIGYKTGKHAVSLLYAITDDRAQQNDQAEAVSLGYVFAVRKGIDLYASYKVHSLDRDGEDFEDISILTTGVRLKL
ncbi:porin [Hahella ganghwensis]|uniref:porin n=1 Tax=Hahella ganghwensis TaxID=286420 RepID=UPI000A058261|nr:porin [Hahella ganghwensis]